MSIMDTYLGWTVEVHYLYKTSTADRGVLAAVEPPWLLLELPNRQLAIPISAIRLLKPIAPPDNEHMRLLRPVERPEEAAGMEQQ